jgi:hypothetical protein
MLIYNDDAQRMAAHSSPFKWDVRGSFGAGKTPGRCREACAAGYLQGTHPQTP